MPFRQVAGTFNTDELRAMRRAYDLVCLDMDITTGEADKREIVASGKRLAAARLLGNVIKLPCPRLRPLAPLRRGFSILARKLRLQLIWEVSRSMSTPS
jgi:hypothetical protein